MKKKALYILGTLAVVLGGLFFGGQAWLKGRFEKGALIQQIESEWNCRAELDSSTVSLFSAPAKVEMKGLRLAPRDAETAKLPGQRPPLDPKTVAASIDHTELSMELWDLLQGKVNIKKLRFDGLGLKGEVDEEGKGTLLTMFSSPDKTTRTVKVGPDKDQSLKVTVDDVHVKGAKVTEIDDKKPDVVPPVEPPPPDENKPKPKEPKVAKEEKKSEPFKAGNMPVSLQVDEAGIHNGRVEITDHGHGTHTLLDRLRFELKGMDVNPADLAHHNTCQLDFAGGFQLDKENTAANTANLELSGNGQLKPFDPGTGEWNPDLMLNLTARKGSQLGGALMKDSMRKKDAAKLKEYGIDLGDIALGGVLGEDVTTEAHLFSGKLMLKQDTRLVFPQYEITLLDGSWFNSSQDLHNVRAKLIANAELSARVLDQAKKKIAERYGNDLASLAETALKAAFFNDKNELVLPFKSKGSISKPEVNLDNALGDVKDLFKDAGATLLKGLLGQ